MSRPSTGGGAPRFRVSGTASRVSPCAGTGWRLIVLSCLQPAEPHAFGCPGAGRRPTEGRARRPHRGPVPRQRARCRACRLPGLSGPVFAVAHRVLGDRSLAEEASQQAFLHGVAGGPHLRSVPGPRAWLATIARRAAIDVHRRSRCGHGSIDELAERGPGALASPTEPTGLRRVGDRDGRRLLRTERAVVRLQGASSLHPPPDRRAVGLPDRNREVTLEPAHRRWRPPRLPAGGDG